jgi:hypothetical protein
MFQVEKQNAIRGVLMAAGDWLEFPSDAEGQRLVEWALGDAQRRAERLRKEAYFAR